MKRYHEIAMVANGNDAVGYFVQDFENKPFNPSDVKKPVFVPTKEFGEMVQRGEVQYLEWFRGSVVASYTDEEIAHLQKLGMGQQLIEDTKNNYFEKDMRFDAKHVALAFDEHNAFVAGCPGEIVSLIGIKMIKITFVGKRNKLESFCNEIVKKNPAVEKTMQFAGTYLVVLLPLMACNVVLCETMMQPLFDTTALKNYKGTKTGKKGLFTKSMLGTPKADEAISLFDSLTNMHAAISNDAFTELSRNADNWQVGKEVAHILQAFSTGQETSEQETSEQPRRIEF